MKTKLPKSLRVSAAPAMATAMYVAMIAPAAAAGFQVNVRDCPNSKGNVAVDTSNVSAWDQVKSKDPSSLVKSMVAESGCFAMVNSSSEARYIMRFGPLTPGEFSAGPSSFSGRSVLEPVSSSGGIPQAGGIPQSGGGIPQSSGSEGGGGFNLGDVDKMLGAAQGVENSAYRAKNLGKGLGNVDSLRDARYGVRGVSNTANSISSIGGMLGGLGGSKAPKDKYAYVEILNSAGQVVARGFGQNNREDLDFTHWSHDAMGVSGFAKKKNSRRAGGALYNAFNDAQNRILSPSFGSPIR